MKEPKDFRILIACEESQAVCKEFRSLGFEAYSCDLLPESGGHPEWHLQCDVSQALKMKWDLIIAFPPCTYLTVTGNRWFNIDVYGESAIQRFKDREAGVKFFMMFANAKCDRIAIENPVGVMSSFYRKPDQIIQPYMFGDPVRKSTCLWLKGLPKLIPTNDVESEVKYYVSKNGAKMSEWYAKQIIVDGKKYGYNTAEFKKHRSKTFPGIARAMSTQWGEYLLQTI